MNGQTTARPAAPAPRTNRMTLDKVTRGKVQKPYRLTLYGVEGIGKSTFAANAPDVVFLGAEDGTSHLDVARLPSPQSWDDVLDAVETLRAQPHEFKSLAIDSLDWIEPLIWRALCERNKWASIEDAGYGKGYVAALDEWRRLLGALERLQSERRMHVILIAHSLVKPFKNPEGPDFDRYQMKLHDKAAGLVKEWSEDVLFTKHEEFASEDKRTKRVRGVSTGARLVYTTRTAAYDAKNRHNLPESMPLGWSDFVSACTQGATMNDEVKAAITANLPKLSDAHRKTAEESLVKAGDDPELLARLNTWVNAKVAS